jgi:hypothetical protein
MQTNIPSLTAGDVRDRYQGDNNLPLRHKNFAFKYFFDRQPTTARIVVTKIATIPMIASGFRTVDEPAVRATRVSWILH